MPRTTKSVNVIGQVKATRAAKAARVAEAGLGGRRTGRASATTRVAQARRDSQQAASAVASAPPATARPSSPAVRASTPPATKKKSPAVRERNLRTTPIIAVRTSHSVRGSAEFAAHAEEVVGTALARFAGRVTRVDVYFSDDNAQKKGDDDKRCQIEVRPASQRPISVTASAATVHKALTMAVGKMKRLMSSQFDRKSRN